MAVVLRERRHLNLKLHLPQTLQHFTPATTTTTAAATSFADLEKLQVLGNGNSGTVYKVRQKQTSAVYALKLVHTNLDPTLRRQTLLELEILRCTDSPYVISSHGTFEKPNGDVAILLEYMDAGTLDHLLKSTGTFSEETIAAVAKQILNGLNYDTITAILVEMEMKNKQELQ